MKKTIEELLESPYWIVDILPKQVPADSPGQYASVEQYYLQEPHISLLRQKQRDLILKLNCYADITVWEKDLQDPEPEALAEMIGREYLSILINDALIVTDPCDTYMTVYDPDEEMLDLIRTLCAGEGLYLWRP